MTGLAFLVEQLTLERHPGDVVVLDVDVVGDFSITLEGVVLFEEPEFPVIELAAALAKWLPDANSPKPPAFRYTSIEAEESPLIAFEPEDDGWFLRSPWQAADQPRPLSSTEIAIATQDFVERLASAVERDLGIEIGHRLTAGPGETNAWETHRSALSPSDRR